MAGPHHGMSRPVQVFFWMGVISTVFYALSLIALIIFPQILTTAALSWFAARWTEFGGCYIVLQILPVISRPVSKDAWEITDHLSSHFPAAIVLIAFPLVWWTRGEWPNSWTWDIWRGSIWISMADVLLTLVSLKISRYAARVTAA